MKKLFNVIFVGLLITTSLFTYKYFAAKAAKHQKKNIACSEEMRMRLPTSLPFENIKSENQKEVVQYIQNFPQTNYQLYSIPKNGLFYLDNFEDLIKSHLRSGQTWEPHIQKLIRQYVRPGSTVLDIGAHIGTHTMVMSKAVGENGRVIAFEPQPKTFKELFMNMSVNQLQNIVFYNAGVGSKNGTIELTPLSFSNEGGTGLLGGGTGKFVPLITIDSLQLKDVSFMKIDVEGMEEEALDGARETILSNQPTIIIEIQGGNEFATASREVRRKILHTIEMLEDLGYHVTQIQTHDWLAVSKKVI